MQATATAALPDLGTVARGTIARDGYGHGSATWTALGTVACRVAPLAASGIEREIAGRLGTDASWVITLPASTTINHRDQVWSGGRVFEVQSIVNRSEEITQRVIAAEVL